MHLRQKLADRSPGAGWYLSRKYQNSGARRPVRMRCKISGSFNRAEARRVTQAGSKHESTDKGVCPLNQDLTDTGCAKEMKGQG